MSKGGETHGLRLMYYVYFGTYTRGKSEGIYVYSMDRSTGKLSLRHTVSGIRHPAFLAFHPNNRFLYAINEVTDFEGGSSGGVSAFAVDRGSGALTLLNSQSSVGSGPCHLHVDRSGKYVMVANYAGGSVAVLPIADDGRLEPNSDFIQHEGSSVNRKRQEQAHAHSITPSPDNRFALVADLGMDKVVVYQLDEQAGKLTPHMSASVSPGAGPRHLDFHPDGRFVYLLNEIGSTVTVFAYDAEAGTLAEIETVSTLPANFSGSSHCAEIRVHPSGRFVYASNRGHDSIAMYSIDRESGRLTELGQESTRGRIPRNFNISPDGRFVMAVNQDSDNGVVFRVDESTGRLVFTGEEIEVPASVCIKFLDAK